MPLFMFRQSKYNYLFCVRLFCTFVENVVCANLYVAVNGFLLMQTVFFFTGAYDCLITL